MMNISWENQAVDDILDVIEEEASEDIFKLCCLNESEPNMIRLFMYEKLDYHG